MWRESRFDRFVGISPEHVVMVDLKLNEFWRDNKEVTMVPTRLKRERYITGKLPLVPGSNS